MSCWPVVFQRAESVLGAQTACVFRPALVQRTHSFDSHSALNQTVPALHVRMQQQQQPLRLLHSQASGSLPSAASSCIGTCDDSLNSCAWYGRFLLRDVVRYRCLAVVVSGVLFAGGFFGECSFVVVVCFCVSGVFALFGFCRLRHLFPMRCSVFYRFSCNRLFRLLY